MEPRNEYPQGQYFVRKTFILFVKENKANKKCLNESYDKNNGHVLKLSWEDRVNQI